MYLITGANGQLGSELKDILGNDNAIYTDKDDLDITNQDEVIEYVKDKNIQYIINCAAYTAVDNAENDKSLARKINVIGAKNLSVAAAEIEAKLIHISTDYVFDGTSHLPYKEEDKTNPNSIYGITKRDGEIEALRHANSVIIIRTAWLYSSYGNNFVKTMRRLGQDRDEIGVIFDQIGSPTYAAHLARAIVDIAPQIQEGEKDIFNYTNEGVTSWFDFAIEIMNLSQINCWVKSIETKDYPTPAMRPHYSVLNKQKIKKRFNIEIPHWKKGLVQCIKKLS